MLKNKVVLIALNKPRGFICTHKDEFDRKKAIDLIPKKTLNNINGKIHSVGRLDYNSQGLLLLTNNTKIKNYLESPSNKIIRIYRVKIQGIVDYKTIKLLRRYISENGKILPSRITSVCQKKQRELSLSIKRARNLALI